MNNTQKEQLKIITYNPQASERSVGKQISQKFVADVVIDGSVVYRTTEKNTDRGAYLEAFCWTMGLYWEELNAFPEICSGVINNEILQNIVPQGAWLLPEGYEADGTAPWSHQ